MLRSTIGILARGKLRAVSTALMVGLLLLPGLALAAQPAAADNPAIAKVWERTDYPVQAGKVARTWVWGNRIAATNEPLAESPSGSREVVYFDKARMEINDPNANSSSPWYVTNGLLVYEMMSGRVQIGMNKFNQTEPARIIVAGDAPITMNPVNFTPNYESLAKVATLVTGQNQSPAKIGQTVRESLSADGKVGTVGSDVPTAGLPKLQYYEKTTGHNVPDVFWKFMNQRGIVYEGGQFREGLLFDWLSTMGYPITEPYWITTYVANKKVSVMMQAFQRRMLTYNPTNAVEWRVEMGNVGAQYYTWRYGGLPALKPTPADTGKALNLRAFNLQGILASRQYSAIKQPLYTAVPTQTAWEDLWTRHTAELDALLPAPRVDFKTEFVVAAFWGDKPNGCYVLSIQSVALKQSTVQVTVNQEVRTGTCTEVITQPNDFVAVSRSGLSPGKYSVVFVDQQGNALSKSEVLLP